LPSSQAENEHVMEMLREEGEDEPKLEPKPVQPKPEAPVRKVRGNAPGGHVREVKGPKKKKAVYGKAKASDADKD
jgi:hypothetical protein